MVKTKLWIQSNPWAVVVILSVIGWAVVSLQAFTSMAGDQEHLRKEFDQYRQAHEGEVKEIKTAVSGLRQNSAAIKEKVGAVQDDVADIKKDVREMRNILLRGYPPVRPPVRPAQ